MYPEWMTKPMEAELVDLGIKSLKTPEQVEKAFSKKKGTTLLVVNSVCGCAAGSARPGLKLALENNQKPDHLYTVFAGVDVEAVAKARDYIKNYPASSPSFGLFKDGTLVSFLSREDIQGKEASLISEQLKKIFNKHCREN